MTSRIVHKSSRKLSSLPCNEFSIVCVLYEHIQLIISLNFEAPDQAMMVF